MRNGPCPYGRYMGYLHDCDYRSSHVGNIYSESKTEPNMSSISRTICFK